MAHSTVTYRNRTHRFHDNHLEVAVGLVAAEAQRVPPDASLLRFALEDWRRQRGWAFGIGCVDLKLDRGLGEPNSPRAAAFVRALDAAQRVVARAPDPVPHGLLESRGAVPGSLNPLPLGWAATHAPYTPPRALISRSIQGLRELVRPVRRSLQSQRRSLGWGERRSRLGSRLSPEGLAKAINQERAGDLLLSFHRGDRLRVGVGVKAILHEHGGLYLVWPVGGDLLHARKGRMINVFDVAALRSVEAGGG